ncbi:MAG: TetR/AcrR family transcriptional regulator [Bacteroidota bacterium]
MSPRTQAQNEVIREHSRQKILDAALRLFAVKGFDGTSVSGIAREAGVAKGLIYNYFKSKEDIVHQIVMSGISESDHVFAELMAQETAQDKMRFLFEFVRTYLKERYEYNKLLHMLAFRLEEFPGLIDIVVAKQTSMMPLFVGILADTGVENAEREAKLLSATMDGIGNQYMSLKEKFPLDEMIDLLIEKYCH